MSAEVIESIKGVRGPQTTLDYVPNMDRLQPNFVVYGDAWQKGVQQKGTQRVFEAMA